MRRKLRSPEGAAAYARRKAVVEPVFGVLKQQRSLRQFRTRGFVIMRDHVHLLLTPQGTTLERPVQLIKGGFSHRLSSKFAVWQRGYSDRRVRDRDEFEQCKSYILQNPVRRGYCARPEEYRWSSAWSGYAHAQTPPDLGPSADLRG